MIPLVYVDGYWIVTKKYLVTILGYDIIVPEFFDTDLASVPRILWAIYPPFGRYMTAAIVHDYVCRKTDIPLRHCHYIFYLLMRRDGVDIFTRFMFYTFVSIFYRRRMLK
jgi:hypothetical protein